MKKTVLFISLAAILISGISYARRMESMQRPLKPVSEKPKVEDDKDKKDKSTKGS